MLGYWTDLSAMTDWRAWAVMVAGVGFIYPVRYAVLWLATAALTAFAHHGQRRDLSAVEPIAEAIAAKKS